MTHTPLPQRPEYVSFNSRIELWSNDGKTQETICRFEDSPDREKHQEFLARAGNAFYPLVEVAERYEALLRKRGCVDGDSKLDFVTAALSLAKGEKA